MGARRDLRSVRVIGGNGTEMKIYLVCGRSSSDDEIIAQELADISEVLCNIVVLPCLIIVRECERDGLLGNMTIRC
jgi:hypothetical protein